MPRDSFPPVLDGVKSASTEEGRRSLVLRSKMPITGKCIMKKAETKIAKRAACCS